MRLVRLQRTRSKSVVCVRDHDGVPREIGARLMEHLEPVQLTPSRYLDLGAGHGLMREPLQRRWPDAMAASQDLSPALLRLNRPRWPWQSRPHRVAAASAALPWRDAAFDLVVSNLGVAAEADPQVTYAAIARLQPAGGLVALSTLGPDSFRELASAWAAIDVGVQLPLMLDMHDHGDLLVAAGYTGVVMDCETLSITYATPAAALLELRALGVHNHGPERPRGLRGRDVIERLGRAMPRDGNGRITITVEVVYAHAWRGSPRGSQSVTLS